MNTILIAVSIASLILSLICLVVVRRSAQRTNCPIVAATVRTRKIGPVNFIYELVVVNAGTRPATNVQFSCDRDSLERALVRTEEGQVDQDVLGCFDCDTTIPFLSHGESVANPFGCSRRAMAGSTWHYGARIPIKIRYRDLGGRAYVSRLTLVIQDSCQFTSGAWPRPQQTQLLRAL